MAGGQMAEVHWQGFPFDFRPPGCPWRPPASIARCWVPSRLAGRRAMTGSARPNGRSNTMKTASTVPALPRRFFPRRPSTPRRCDQPLSGDCLSRRLDQCAGAARAPARLPGRCRRRPCAAVSPLPAISTRAPAIRPFSTRSSLTPSSISRPATGFSRLASSTRTRFRP